MLTGRKKHGRIEFDGEDIIVTSGTNLKYLEVKLDKSLNFGEHNREITDRAEKLVVRLSHLIPNTRGLISAKRKLLTETVHSTMERMNFPKRNDYLLFILNVSC